MLNKLPDQMTALKQWVCYKAIPRNGKITKVPVNPHNATPIDCNNERNWLTFNDAVSAVAINEAISGIGFVFTENDNFVGIDIDGCVDENGNLSSVAEDIVNLFSEKAYIEFSPSGKGLHIITLGNKCGTSSKNATLGLEMYDRKRYFTVTGDALFNSATLEDCSDEIETIYHKYFVKKEEQQSMVSIIENDILELMFAGKNGDRLRSLYDGQWESYYPSQSEADLALCNALAFYTGKDANEMDMIFRKSGLFRPKWDQIHYADGRTYGDSVIENAIDQTAVVFEKNNSASNKKSKNKVKTEEIPIWYEKSKSSLILKSGILAEYLAENMDFIFTRGTVYQYCNGVYKALKDEEIKAIIYSKLNRNYSKSTQVKDVLEQLKIQILFDSSLLDSPQHLRTINFKNGLFDIENRKLTPHALDFYTTFQVNAEYNPSADCPHFKKFIAQSMDSDDILIAQELLGYLLIPTTIAEKAFILYGPGRSGKSTFLKLIEFILGKEHYSSISMQDLSDKFKPALLVDKLANIFADLPNKRLDDTGIFKAIVSGDTIVVEDKYGKPFPFNNKARLIFSCNELPANYIDRTDGFFRRLIILPFLNQVPESEIDPFLLSKLQSEVEGIILWALEGLERLIKNKFQFTKSESTKKLLDEYRKESNNVIWFIEEYCEFIPGEKEYSQSLYQAYKRKCEENGKQPISQMKFNKSIENEYKGKIIRQEDPSNRRIIYKGITINPMK
ncbi:phage/plasmid primase, P4 family [Solibacillus merdavium]|uniref:SF3 helicase domain-containing protein n=1 Tax=Solibacillus merdavium TaxID=2762218 RepID=A0ABR8XLV9_9BACL|nr:phage/plasmid primase, P4 family [Solibacillus merdavium]MBD8032929.1 hypothetical protein [Solibacillus merdavium]